MQIFPIHVFKFSYLHVEITHFSNSLSCLPFASHLEELSSEQYYTNIHLHFFCCVLFISTFIFMSLLEFLRSKFISRWLETNSVTMNEQSFPQRCTTNFIMTKFQIYMKTISEICFTDLLTPYYLCSINFIVCTTPW